MSFLDIVNNGEFNIRRECWPEKNYINVSKKVNNTGTVSYWDNDSFHWKEVYLSLTDIAANDWTIV